MTATTTKTVKKTATTKKKTEANIPTNEDLQELAADGVTVDEAVFNDEVLISREAIPRYKSRYKLEPISEVDQKRIAGDARLAIQALQAMINVGSRGAMHPTYFLEKFKVLESCYSFISSFALNTEEDKDD